MTTDSGSNDTGPNEIGPENLRLSARHLTPLVANRALLIYFLVQNLLVGVLVALRVAIGPALLLSGAATLLVFAVVFRDAWAELRASARWRTPPDLLAALGALGLGFVASRGVLVFVASVFPNSLRDIPQFEARGGGLIWLVLSAGVLIPFVEELIFRGFGLASYERRRGALFAAVSISALFAFVHGVPAQVAGILPLAWVLARCVQFSGSLWTGVIVHALNNTFAVVVASLLTGNQAFGKLLDESAQASVSLGAGLAGLLVAALSLWAATAWLRPRVVEPRDERGGPVWSGSLLAVVLLTVLVVAFTLLQPSLPTFNLPTQ